MLVEFLKELLAGVNKLLLSHDDRDRDLAISILFTMERIEDTSSETDFILNCLFIGATTSMSKAPNKDVIDVVLAKWQHRMQQLYHQDDEKIINSPNEDL